MTQPPSPGLIQSVRTRLRQLATADGANFQTILERYAIERLLYRLASSPLRDRFILKGATVFLAWGGEMARPSRDLDMLSFGPTGIEDLIESFRMIAAAPVEPDGLVFPPETIKGGRIKEGQEYEGVRLNMYAMLGNVRIPVQVDVGFGDAVTPPPFEGSFPTLLALPAPQLLLYPREVVVAEKFQALVSLGMTNTRLKDFHDLWTLAQRFDFDGQLLAGAMRATFERRRTELPVEAPVALTADFAAQAAAQWTIFTQRSALPPADFAGLVQPALVGFLLPASRVAREEGGSPGYWPKGGPWQPGAAAPVV